MRLLQPYCNPNRTQLYTTGNWYGPKVLVWPIYAEFSDGIGCNRRLILGLKIMVSPVRIRVSPLLFSRDLQVKHRGKEEPRLWIEARRYQLDANPQLIQQVLASSLPVMPFLLLGVLLVRLLRQGVLHGGCDVFSRARYHVGIGVEGDQDRRVS